MTMTSFNKTLLEIFFAILLQTLFYTQFTWGDLKRGRHSSVTLEENRYGSQPSIPYTLPWARA